MKQPNLLSCSLLLSSGLLFSCGGTSETTDITDSADSTESVIIPETTSALVINEIVAAAVDDGNDWIELYVVEGTISLANYSIVDDNSEHDPQALPDVTLAEGEFIVIQAIDEEDTPPDSGYYVTFKLGSDDAVTLYKEGEQVDQLDWQEGDALTGTSYGLFADGIMNPQVLTPTPGAANEETTDTESDPETDTSLFDTIINENASLRINEIVAKASDGGHDWIELYVTGDSSVNLSDYSLADDNNELVNLPNVTLAPGDFYQIFATTDEVSELESVSFKLGSGDQVSLFKGDDLIDQLSWNKGQALIGYSYGRLPDGSDGTQTLETSPLAANTVALHGPLIINEVVASDINEGNDWFELYNNSDADILLSDYQIIDESDDIEAATLPDVVLSPNEYIVIYATDVDPNDYYVPFKLGKEDELNLIFKDETVDYIDWDDSDLPIGFSYGLSDNNIGSDWDKDTLTPTPGTENILASAFNPAIVQDLAINITTENWQSILANPLDEEYHEASISLNGVTLDSVAIRTKGGSSLRSVANSTSDRYSFKLDINEYVSGQKFFGLKKFTLQNSFNDPSYMREVIAYELLDEMGVPTPKNSYVNVYINGELFGFYLMVEAIDGEFLENNFANSNGDLYKPDGTGSDLQWINADITSYSDINLQTNEESTDNGAFLNFVEQLDNGASEVIDIDGLLRYMSVSVALSNLDSYHGALAHNYYLYEQDGVFSLLPWDFNEAFGSFSMGCESTDVRELYIDEPTSVELSERPMLANAFADEANLTTYHGYLWQLINGPLQSDTFNNRVNEVADLIREHVANDPSAFYGEASFEQNLNFTVSRFYGLTEFIDYRVNNMTMQLQGSIASSASGNGFCASGGR